MLHPAQLCTPAALCRLSDLLQNAQQHLEPPLRHDNAAGAVLYNSGAWV